MACCMQHGAASRNVLLIEIEIKFVTNCFQVKYAKPNAIWRRSYCILHWQQRDTHTHTTYVCAGVCLCVCVARSNRVATAGNGFWSPTLPVADIGCKCCNCCSWQAVARVCVWQCVCVWVWQCVWLVSCPYPSPGLSPALACAALILWALAHFIIFICCNK